MEFNNKCDATFNNEDLAKAIIMQCKVDGKKPKEQYSISCRGGYPSICIAHNHYRIHALLGRLYFGDCEAIHHIDENKLNALRENLIPLSNKEHIKIHNPASKVSEQHKKNFGERVANIIRRNDVSEAKVKDLRKQGLTIPQIAKELNCGYNTVCRRLGMKTWR